MSARSDQSLGTATLEDGGGRVDFPCLRRERREKCLAEMARQEIDFLVLGREGNGRYVCGARRLWLAGARPFAPRCILSRESREVHLLTLSDDDVPAEIPRRNLFGGSWNPANFAGALDAIPGFAAARRIGVDGMSPFFDRLIRSAAPKAEIVDGEALMRSVRRRKLPREIACIETAIAIAEGALAETLRHVRAGVSERALAGRYAEAITRYGVTIPAFEGTFCTTPRESTYGEAAPLRQLSDTRVLNDGDLVAASVGVLYGGYEGSLARTWPCAPGRTVSAAERELSSRWRGLWQSLAAELRPGQSAVDLVSAHQRSGEPLPPLPIAHGVGLGVEAPVIGRGFAFESEPFETGMVLAVQGYVWRAGTGGYLAKEIVHITADGYEQLTRHSHGPLAEADSLSR